MPYKKFGDRTYTNDVVSIDDILHPSGAQSVTLYKGIIVQWDMMMLCEKRIFSVIDTMEWKVRVHLLRVFSEHDQVYLLWRSYMSFIPRGYTQHSFVEVECKQGEENQLDGSITRPGKFFYTVQESVIVHAERKV